MEAKSLEISEGLTLVTLPLVSSTILLKVSILQPSPLIVITLTTIPNYLANSPNSSQNLLASQIFSSDNPSKEPKPILAKPSVQTITIDPGLPLLANYIEVNKAGPKAVLPHSSSYENLFTN